MDVVNTGYVPYLCYYFEVLSMMTTDIKFQAFRLLLPTDNQDMDIQQF